MVSESRANTLKENWKILLSKELLLIFYFLWLYVCNIKETLLATGCLKNVCEVFKVQFSHAFSLNSCITSYIYIQICCRNCKYGHLRSWRSGTSLYTISCIVRSGLQDNIKPCYQLAVTIWKTELSKAALKNKHERFFRWKCFY